MDDQLLIQIQATIDQHNLDCKLMEQGLVDSKIEEICLAFKLDRNSIFPSEHLEAIAERCYGADSNLWLDTLTQLASNLNAEMVLVITDNHSYPWIMLTGGKNDVIELIKEQRFFEYFLTDSALNFILFDTHHNSLLLSNKR